jgi:glycosyltransferase involved in cell wall biosynthesis
MAADAALLLLLHSDPLAANPGGTEMHVLDRIESLGLPRAVVAFPSDAICVTAIDFTGRRRECYSFELKQSLERFSHAHEEAEKLLLSIAGTFGVAAVSAEQLISWPLNAMARLRQAGLPLVCVNHDFYSVCPSFNLVDVTRKSLCSAHADPVANLPQGLVQNSTECLRGLFMGSKTEPPIAVECLLEAHQRIFGEILLNAEKIVFPSASARRIVLRNYRLDEARTAVIPHGYPAIQSRPKRPRPGTRLRIALIGQVTHPIKGSEFILELLRETATLALEWHFFGECDTMNFQQRVDATGARRMYHGPYARREIVPKLIEAGIDVALFTSICPETFSFTLSEAWLAGVPAIVPRLGALEERVSQTGLGWIIEPNSKSEGANLLRRLQQNRELIQEMHARMDKFTHTTLAENAAAYREIYSPLLARAPLTAAEPLDLSAAARCYVDKRREREAREAASMPAYKRSIFYETYRRLKHFLPQGMRQALYNILAKKTE